MTQQMQIKDPAAKGSTPTEIKEATGFSYPAIRKYLAKEDFSPKRPVKRTEESILDPYKPLLAKMFEEDRRIYHIVGSDLARRPSGECSEASSDIIDAASASLYM